LSINIGKRSEIYNKIYIIAGLKLPILVSRLVLAAFQTTYVKEFFIKEPLKKALEVNNLYRFFGFNNE